MKPACRTIHTDEALNTCKSWIGAVLRCPQKAWRRKTIFKHTAALRIEVTRVGFILLLTNKYDVLHVTDAPARPWRVTSLDFTLPALYYAFAFHRLEGSHDCKQCKCLTYFVYSFTAYILVVPATWPLHDKADAQTTCDCMSFDLWTVHARRAATKLVPPLEGKPLLNLLLLSYWKKRKTCLKNRTNMK